MKFYEPKIASHPLFPEINALYRADESEVVSRLLKEVNRNMIGAMVGVQPFGGEGLSGTGPKAGGPHYLYRFATERTLSINTPLPVAMPR